MAKAFAILEQARGRVMTDLLMSGAKASPEAVAAEHKIAELRLNLMSAHSDQDIAQLRDAIFLAEQSRSITPEISILKAKEHKTITLAQLQNSCLHKRPSSNTLLTTGFVLLDRYQKWPPNRKAGRKKYDIARCSGLSEGGKGQAPRAG